MTLPARYAALFSTLGVVATSPSLAADHGCRLMTIEVDPLMRQQWPDLPDRIRGALAGWRDVDLCARTTVRWKQRMIVLDVVLPDGRSASRMLSRVENVVPTLEALLLLPVADAHLPEPEMAGPDNPVETSAKPSASRTPTQERAPDSPVIDSARQAEPRPRERATTTIVSVAAAPTAEQSDARFRLEFSLATDARVGSGQVGVGLAVLTFFDIRGWLLGFEAAAQEYRDMGDSPATSALELALLGGRRFRFERTAIDVVAGPALAVPGIGRHDAARAQAGSHASAAPAPTSDGPSTRLVGSARVNFRMRSLVRPFAGIEGELGFKQSAPAASPAPSPPHLPAWTFGVVVGATLGTP
jgi:hypothetical protein